MTTCVELEAWILLNEPLEAAPEQRRADEQHDGKADSGDHERAARAAPRACCPRRCRAGFFSGSLHVAARHQDVPATMRERQRVQTGERDRKPEHARIDARRADALPAGARAPEIRRPGALTNTIASATPSAVPTHGEDEVSR